MKELIRVLGYLTLCFLFTLAMLISALASN